MKDYEMTKKELSALCRKQEDYIKELEDKLYKSSQTEKCEVAKPSYEQLIYDNNLLREYNTELNKRVDALMRSLSLINDKFLEEVEKANFYFRQYTSESKRANKLFDELEECTNSEKARLIEE